MESLRRWIKGERRWKHKRIMGIHVTILVNIERSGSVGGSADSRKIQDK